MTFEQPVQQHLSRFNDLAIAFHSLGTGVSAFARIIADAPEKHATLFLPLGTIPSARLPLLDKLSHSFGIMMWGIFRI